MEEERGGTSYTVDTLKALRKMCAADVRIDFVLGADALAQIEGWKNADELLTLCRLVVVGRDGYEIHAKRLRKKYNAQIEVLDINTPPVSGTAIRKRVAEGKPIRFLLPREAEDYIQRHGLYGCPPFSFERARQALSLTLSPRRFEHTLGVVEEAERLAVLYHADVDKARIAALLHDCAKEYSPAKKRTLCALWHIPLCETLSAQIDLTHGLLGAEAARRDFGVYDEEILQAIRFHIAGHKDLTLLDKIILLADFIEPTREDYPGLTQIRELAYTDINAAILCGLRVVMQDNFERKRLIHPWSMDAVNTLEGQMNGK
jgi:nicotinate-nucleotide adenylyltransferase